VSEESIIRATHPSQKGQSAPVDMGPQKIGDLDIEQSRLIRDRQQSRARMMGLILGGLCILFFLVTIVKVGVWK
jgi:hypothetical protein